MDGSWMLKKDWDKTAFVGVSKDNEKNVGNLKIPAIIQPSVIIAIHLEWTCKYINNNNKLVVVPFN